MLSPSLREEFCHEDGDSIFLRKTGKYLLDYKHHTEQFAEAIDLLSCIPEVTGSKLVLIEFFRDFSGSFQTNVNDSTLS